ncbi:auxin-responsive protein SAUR71-like [Andrographis paniculata]|uniref:auxin-responsive protein SAUR71-like n=1 Tax=Andrographis paniculata TaxID=175694 RepID=UPI0021E8A338|nr:auxin-responsive protein SAUR71-like [Andrographis paniculata]
MKKLMRKFSKVADSSQYCLLRSETRRTGRCAESYRKRDGGVPEGHLPVYVGEEMERFVVSAELLNHPIFVTLLNKSAQEYGYEQKGVLRIPCHVFLFERVLEALRVGGEARDLQEILSTLSDEL